MTESEFNESLSSADEPREDGLTRGIEALTTKIPSVAFLCLALGSMAFSIGAELTSEEKKKSPGTFIGLWAPTLLMLGVYNKLAKMELEAKLAGKAKRHQNR